MADSQASGARKQPCFWGEGLFDARKLRVVRTFVAETGDCVEPPPW